MSFALFRSKNQAQVAARMRDPNQLSRFLNSANSKVNDAVAIAWSMGFALMLSSKNRIIWRIWPTAQFRNVSSREVGCTKTGCLLHPDQSFSEKAIVTLRYMCSVLLAPFMPHCFATSTNSRVELQNHLHHARSINSTVILIHFQLHCSHSSSRGYIVPMNM